MKKLLSLLVICSVLFSAVFFGCDHFTPPDVQESVPAENAGLTDPDTQERKDVLALKHLQITTINEDTLASYVMDFINITAASGTERNVQSAPAVVITKTTRITHTVETGFAETTADKRSARSVIGPGQIPFYVFTLENQDSGETGFALTCGDSRIGAVLAVVEQGNYDDVDNPFMAIFYTGLNAYIENTIRIYNSITEADIENALNKTEAARSNAPNLPVTDIGKTDKLKPVGTPKMLETVRWSQRSHNGIIMIEKRTPSDYYYVAGCVPVAIAQIMAYHGKKMADEGKNPYSSSDLKVSGYNVAYNWNNMVAGKDNTAVGVLMWEIGQRLKANYKMALITKGGAETGASRNDSRIAYRNMGYEDPGNFIKYNLEGVKFSIYRGEPVQVAGYSEIKAIILGIPVYDGGHNWVIDGHSIMTSEVKIKATGENIPDYPLDYVHCNLGWGPGSLVDPKSDEWDSSNGWYISGVFDTNNIPQGTRSNVDGFYQYNIQMLTGIRPK